MKASALWQPWASHWLSSRYTYLKRLRARRLVENVGEKILASEALF